MEEGGAYGGTKVDGQVDPMAYLKKPSVIFRVGALVSVSLPKIDFVLLCACEWRKQQVLI